MRYAYVQVEQRVATRARVKTDPENQHRNSRCSFCRVKPARQGGRQSAVFSTPTLITFALRMAYMRGNLNYGVSERKNSGASEVSLRAHCALRIAREEREERKARERTRRGAPVIYKPLKVPGIPKPSCNHNCSPLCFFSLFSSLVHDIDVRRKKPREKRSDLYDASSLRVRYISY